VCNNYRNLSDGNHAQGSQSGDKCDEKMDPGWYRFQGADGDPSNKCVPQNQCGTFLSSWFGGGHPTVTDGVVTRTVCVTYRFSDNCCYWNGDVSVKNCGKYFVYELKKPLGCPLQHCGNGLDNGSSGKSPFMMVS